jgi:hypothetical protein
VSCTLLRFISPVTVQSGAGLQKWLPQFIRFCGPSHDERPKTQIGVLGVFVLEANQASTVTTG